MSRVWARLALVLCVSAGAACAAHSGSPMTTGRGTLADGVSTTIIRPEGAGPFPAVVLMHDCSGLGPRSSGAPGRWARVLVGRGYLVSMPDSFTPRGVPDGVCTGGVRGIDVSHERRARDAYAALADLRARPDVDGRRIGLMGGSHGGSTTLVAMQADGGAAPPAADGPGFAAAVALYPRCAVRGALRGDASGVYRAVAPLLILIGDKDDWTPAEPCRQLVEAAARAGSPVAIKIYPGAHHSFDSPNPVRYVAARLNPSAPGGRGATTGGHPQAWADAIQQVAAFFGRHLAVVPSRAQEIR